MLFVGCLLASRPSNMLVCLMDGARGVVVGWLVGWLLGWLVVRLAGC